MGLPLLLESVGEELDPVIDPILSKATTKKGGNKVIRFADKTIDYADDFQLYMTSRYANPHYLPELTTKVTIINFMITFEGLREQLLNLVVRKENEDLADERDLLINEQHQDKQEQIRIEAEILKVLRESDKNILDDEKAINKLQKSQEVSQKIKERQ